MGPRTARGLKVKTDLVGAIDIGTNSTNLLISTSTGTRLQRMNTPTRLGAGLDSSGNLADDAVARTLECLSDYRARLDSFAVDKFRAVATSACRRAQNFPAFAHSAEMILGRPVELLSGESEGRLSHRGATSRVVGDALGHLVIDIGGGSTELIFARQEIEVVCSLEVGAVRLTEKHLLHDPPLPEELLNAIAEVQDSFSDACRETPQLAHSEHLIGCSGTILTIAAVEIGSPDLESEHVDGFHLSRAAVEDVFRTLATEPLTTRVHNPGLPRVRADIIVGGCCILVALLRTLEAQGLTVSSGNILDGICREIDITS